MKNYTVYHLHSDLSNGTMMDSATKYEAYIKLAKENNMAAIAFSEHGNVLQWIKKKLDCDKAKIKYIHGSEFYMASTLDEKLRETFHIGLYAKNWDGVKEINKLSSVSFQGKGEEWQPGTHYYYRPRISMEEIMNTSDNIIVITACMASILYKNTIESVSILETHEDKDEAKRISEKKIKDRDTFLSWLSQNKHRCFLEIQYHKDKDQINYNKMLYEWSKQYKIPMIAGTDTHSSNETTEEIRKVLQASKNIRFEEEEAFDLKFKSYDEIVQMFEKQNCLPKEVYLEAIENTNVFADMIEHFDLDFSHKYPKISDKPEQDLKNRINIGVKRRGIPNWNKEKREQYYQRLHEEFDVFKKLGMLDYVLLVDDIIVFCRENGISTAPRGSCNGSLIFWALGITDIDSIKFNLPFFRFANPERVSLGDVDIDMSGSNRPLVKDFLYNYKGIQGSAIVTFQTFALRGAVRSIGRGLGYGIELVDEVAKDIDEIDEEDEYGEIKKITTFNNKEKWLKKYPKWIELSHETLGIIENTSVHACGFVATNRNIDEEIGTYLDGHSRWEISQNNMKAIDAINFVKMDFLVVDNVQLIEDTCKLAGVPILDNDTIDFEDDAVWDEMLKSGLGIFQFEKTGWRFLKKTLENYKKNPEKFKGMSRLDILTALNGIIRPAGDSIREDFVQGEMHDNGHPAINEFLSSTLGNCIFQEQIMLFLYIFCGYSMAQSDIVRRGIAKKDGTEQLLPAIEAGFNKFMAENYDIKEEESKPIIDKFLQIVLDASDYGFSTNHSCPYSILGYKGAYLRHYYPLEFLTIQFSINEGKTDKTYNINKFRKEHTNIELYSIKFRKSQSQYTIDKENNAIYKGMKSIKYLNQQISEELYKLRENKYDDFVDLVRDIKENTSCDKRQMEILIKLNYFDEFGESKSLFDLYDLMHSGSGFKYDKKHKEATKEKRIELLKEKLKEILSKNEKFTIKEKLEFDLEYLGYMQQTENVSKNKLFIVEIETKYSPKATCYCILTGETKIFKIGKRDYNKKPIKTGDIISVFKYDKKQKTMKNPDENSEKKFIPVEGFDWWIEDYDVEK